MPGRVQMTCEECGFEREFNLRNLYFAGILEEDANDRWRDRYKGEGYKWVCANCGHKELGVFGAFKDPVWDYTNALDAHKWGIAGRKEPMTDEWLEEIRQNEVAGIEERLEDELNDTLHELAALGYTEENN